MAFPKINRIKNKKDFERIFKKAQGTPQSFKNNLLVLKITENNLKINRIGLVVNQKISKKANVRNKIKRRLIEAIKSELKSIKTGKDFIAIALPGIEKKNFSDIKKSVKNILTCLN
jgi:ribonuclease P protein component